MSRLMVVFEGPECTGKSTMIQHIASLYDCQINKRVACKDPFMRLSTVVHDIMEQKIMHNNPDAEKLVLFDRWQLVSDMIYSPMFSNEISVFQPHINMLFDECVNCNILFVHVTASKEVIQERIIKRGDNLVGANDALRLQSMYENYFEQYRDRINYERIDTTAMSKEVMLDRVECLIQKYMKIV